MDYRYEGVNGILNPKLLNKGENSNYRYHIWEIGSIAAILLWISVTVVLSFTMFG